MTLAWDHYEYRIAEHYLSALINGDTTGLDDADEATLNAWQDNAQSDAVAYGFTVGHWTDVDGSGEDWGRCDVSGLFAMRCTVRLMVYRQPVVPPERYVCPPTRGLASAILHVNRGAPYGP